MRTVINRWDPWFKKPLLRKCTLTLLFQISLVIGVFGGEQQVRFQNYSVDDGLSQSSVLCIYQTQDGFLWFGTQDGLNRFDGYHFRIFKNRFKDPTSLSDNWVLSLEEDDQGRLWVGTSSGGLNLYNPELESFQRFTYGERQPSILSIHQGSQHLWISMGEDGLGVFNQGTGKIDPYEALAGKKVYQVLEDNEQQVWFATDQGLFCEVNGYMSAISDAKAPVTKIMQGHTGNLWFYRPDTGIYHMPSFGAGVQPKLVLDQEKDLGNGEVYQLKEDRQGTVWIATYGAGLKSYKPSLRQLRSFKTSAQPNTINSNNVHSIFEDQTGMVWFGTWGGGINVYDPMASRFNHYLNNPEQMLNVSYNSVSSITEDAQGGLWVGIFSGGLHRFAPNNRSETELTHYPHDPKNERSLSSNRIRALLSDQKNQLWVGTTDRGLNLYHEDTNDFTRFLASDDPKALGSNQIRALTSTLDGSLWIGTTNGLYQMKEYGVFTAIPQKTESQDGIAGSAVAVIFEDPNEKDEVLWVGSDFGLTRYDRNNQTFRHFQHNPTQENSLSHNGVKTIYKDAQERLWIGTNSGLNRFDRERGNFQSYRETDGFPNDFIYSILGDNAGYLWMSTNKGLVRFHPETESIKTYGVQDGLQGNEFNSNAYYQNRDGEMFFGGLAGFNAFHPEMIQEDPIAPKVAFISLFVSDKESKPKGPILSKTLNHTRRLVLDHTQSVFAISLAAMHYRNPKHNLYAYQLKGFDKDWRIVNAENRKLTYTNLSPGAYTLFVKAANQDGVWGQPKEPLTIVIAAPPWRSWWAFSLYSLVIIAMIWFLWHFFAQRKQNAMNQTVVAQLQDVDRLKDEFLANTSHELRTPLNGIIGLVDSLLTGVAGELPPKAKENLSLILASGKRLSALINDILDFSKLKDRSLHLELSQVDLYVLADVVIQLTKPIVGEKPLVIHNDIPRNFPPVQADKRRLEQVLVNLLSNAIKFTDKGEVRIAVQERASLAEIGVRDTGIGIPEDKLNEIFHPFKQVSSGNQRTHIGTGLGLSISEMLLNLHGSNLMVDSELGKGTRMSFTLSFAKDDTPSTQTQVPVLAKESDSQVLTNFTTGMSANPSISIDNDGKGFHILVVDDEEVNRQVLHDYLSLKSYTVHEASSGTEALVILEEKHIDLILLDLVMPYFSGYEVCRKIRETHSEEALPIIFLSARTEVSDISVAFDSGANDYLAKPVSQVELFARLKIHLHLLRGYRNMEQLVDDRSKKLEATSQELQEVQQAAILQEKMAALGLITAGVAHEIKNPIAFTHTSAQNLEAGLNRFFKFLESIAGDDGKEVMAMIRTEMIQLFDGVELITEGTTRVKEILRDLRLVSGRKYDEIIEVNLSEHIRSTINLIQPNFNLDVRFQVNLEEKLQLECWPGQLSQVLMNLVVNGCDAVLKRKRDESIKELLAIKIRAWDGGHEMIIEIEDEGCGISKEVQEKMFQAFYTTKGQVDGTGLGLAISQKIIAKHEGRIQVKSTIGQGTVMTIYLPKKKRNTHEPAIRETEL